MKTETSIKTEPSLAKITRPKSVAPCLKAAWASSLLLLALELPAAAQAQFTYTTNNGTITITGAATNSSAALTIPGTINGLPVTSIGAGAFQSNLLSSITIPSSVTTIGDQAFYYCTNLDWEWGRGVHFQGDAPSLGSNVFGGDGGYVFYVAGTTGWGTTFGGLETELWDPQSQMVYTATNGIVTILFYVGPPGAVNVPAMIDGSPVTTLGGGVLSAFSRLVTSVIIPDSVTSIAQDAFESCQDLTNIALGRGVSSIGTWAFSDCTKLTGIILPSSVTNLGPEVFFGSWSLVGVYFEGSAPPQIAPSPFTGLSQVTVYYVPGTAGWGLSYDGAPTAPWNPQIPFNYTTNNGAITITGYTGPGGVVTIPSAIYSVPVTSIGGYAFTNCANIASVTLPSSITNIGAGAFANCIGLTNITILDSVTRIGDAAFSGCTSLTSVDFQGNAPAVGSNEFVGDTIATAYYLPGATGWGATFGGIPTSLWNPSIPFTYTAANHTVTITGYTGPNGPVTIPDTINFLPVTAIGDFAFEFPKATNTVTSVTIPDTVTSIGDSAFSGCASLTNITLGNGVMSLGNDGFNGCSGLTSVTIPSSLTSLGDSAFYGCTGLKQVYFLGNAPTLSGGDFFGYDTKVTLYRLPGTTGWDAIAPWLPTVVWTPEVRTGDASFGVRSGWFRFNIAWATGMTVVVEATTNLVNPVWTPLVTNALACGTASFSDPRWTNYPGRLYRLRWP